MSATAFDAIPAELRAIPRWVCWRTQLSKVGRPAKVPKRATSRGNASSTDPTTWSTYELAVAGVHRFGHDGIGFVLSGDDDLVGIDLDHCRDPKTGALLPTAEALVESFSTYSESSASGTGVHIILHGERPLGAGNRNRLNDVDVEIYSDGRYFVVTGNAIRREPVMECQFQLERLCEQLWPQSATPSSPVGPNPDSSAIHLDDDELIAKASAAAQGAQFTALWKGDWSGYASRSEADYELVEQLAFWSNCDREQIERLWLRSGLRREARHRKKLERVDYLARTIDSGCERAASRGCYQGRAPNSKRCATSANEGAAVKEDLSYFKLSPRIWQEPWSVAAKVLAIYILCNRYRFTEGLYRLAKSYICEDLGWTPEQLAGPFAELLAAGFMEYDDKVSVVFITKALKWQSPDNPNGVKHAARLLREVPDTPLFEKLLRAAETYAPKLAERLPELLPERFDHPRLAQVYNAPAEGEPTALEGNAPQKLLGGS